MSDATNVAVQGPHAVAVLGLGSRRRPVRGHTSAIDDHLARLRRIEGQVRGLERMVGTGARCPDVVIQIAAVTRALQEVATGMLDNHLRCCVLDATRRSEVEGQYRLEEVAASIRQVVRL